MRIAILLILSMSQAQDWFPLATSLAGNGTPYSSPSHSPAASAASARPCHAA